MICLASVAVTALVVGLVVTLVMFVWAPGSAQLRKDHFELQRQHEKLKDRFGDVRQRLQKIAADLAEGTRE